MLSEAEVKSRFLKDLKKIKDKNREEVSRVYNLLTSKRGSQKEYGFIVERINVK